MADEGKLNHDQNALFRDVIAKARALVKAQDDEESEGVVAGAFTVLMDVCADFIDSIDQGGDEKGADDEAGAGSGQ